MTNPRAGNAPIWTLASCLWFCLFVVLPTTVQAQPTGRASSGEAVQRSSVITRSVSSSATAVPVRGPCDPDYWIVSTRLCKHQVECCQPCNYQVYRFDGPGGGRCGSLEELYSSLQPGVPVCFMAHGSFVEWGSMLQDCAETYRWLRKAAPTQPIHVIFFTWPSDDSTRLIRTLDVNVLGRRAELNSLYLAELISRVPAEHPICLIGHSHGARMVSAAVHAMAGGVIEGRCFGAERDRGHRIRLVLAAAAIDHDWFNPGSRFEMTLHRADAVLNLRNRHDVPLLLYPTRRLCSRAALAVTGVMPSDRMKLGERSIRIDDLDVTHLVEMGHIWSHYYRYPDIACAIRHFVYFDEPR